MTKTKEIEQQTELEKDFVKKVLEFSKETNITPVSVFHHVGYTNSTKVHEFMSGTGSITGRIMGKVLTFMFNYK